MQRMDWIRWINSVRRAPKPLNRHGDTRALLRPETSVFCAWVRDQAFAFLDDDLTAPDRRALKSHLNDCADCHAYVEECRQVEGVLTSAHQSIPAPGDLRSGFYARLGAADGVRERRRRNLRVAAPAFAACLVACIVGGSFLLPHGAPKTLGPGSHIAAIERHSVGLQPGLPGVNTGTMVSASRMAGKSLRLAFKLPLHPTLSLARISGGQRFPTRLRVRKPSYVAFVSRVKPWDLGPVASLPPSEQAAIRVATLLSEDMNGNGLEFARRSFDKKLALKSDSVAPASTTTDMVIRYENINVGASAEESSVASGPSNAPIMPWEPTGTEVSLHVSDEVRGFATPAHVSGAVDERIESGSVSEDMPVTGEQPPLPAADAH